MALVKEEVPVPLEGEVLVRITHAGLCGSDLWLACTIACAKLPV